MMETIMHPRLNASTAAPDALKAMLGLETYIKQSGLELSLVHLVKMRASQINGCAYCLQMHSKDARAHGENEQRLYLLNAWYESPLYTSRERAALAWTDAVTRISQTHAPDDVYAEVARQFDEAEQVKLTMVIATINAWNRLAISFRMGHAVKQGEGNSSEAQASYAKAS
jgi:AhpD family alkylhydroperoxidase